MFIGWTAALFARNIKTVILKGGFDPLLAFFYRIIGQSDKKKFDAGTDIHFNGNGSGIDAINGAAVSFG